MTDRYKLSTNPGQVHYGRARLRPRPLRTPVVSPTWFLVLTNPKCEERAKQGLHALGYATFLPTETVWVRIPKHRQKKDGPTKHKVTRPLFPGYLFAGLDRGIHPFEPIRLTDGVYSIAMNDGQYMAIPDGVIAEMIQRQERGEHDKTIKVAQRLLDLVGTQIIVPDGAFAGFAATVRKATEKKAHLVTEAFGKRVRLTMPLEDLQSLC